MSNTWNPAPKRHSVSVGSGILAGAFEDVTPKKCPRDTPYVIPHITINRSGACSIVNSFLIEQGINPNNLIQIQHDANLAMLRFRLDRFVDPLTHNVKLVQAKFTLDKEIARGIVTNAGFAINSFPEAAKALFVICRKDKQGWYYAKACGHRYQLQPPRWWDRLSEPEKMLWHLPHNIK